MKKLIIVILFVIATFFMGRTIIHDIVGEFHTQNRLGYVVIYLSLVLFSYKLVYFIFDLMYSLFLELNE